MERAAKSNIISKIITSLLFALALTGTNIANAQVKVVVIPMFDEVAAAKWRGAWTNATPYDIGDIVEFDDSSYIAKLDHTSSQSITPLDIDTWDLVARGGDDGAQGLKGDTGAAGGAQGLKVIPAQQVHKASKVIPAQQVHKASKVIPAQQVHKASKVIWGHKALKEPMA
ncbi:MAG: hypothetical protein ACI9PZ_001008 [Parvicella sp.]|jgi:hypothetical protein